MSIVRNGLSFVVQAPVIRAFGPNEGPIDRPDPDDGRKGSRARDNSRSRPFMSVQAPRNGAEAATLVSRSDATTAVAMKIEPPRRYRPEIADGSPIRLRTQSDCSSKVWKRTSRKS